jgi:outer membrane protein assembly factor BamB
LYADNRPLQRSAIIILILASFVLAACGAGGTSSNWPGLTTDGQAVYVAYGPGVVGFDAETQQQVFTYPAEPSATLAFFAAPSIQDGQLVLGDYGSSSGPFSPQTVVTLYGFSANDSRWDMQWEKSGLATGSIVASPLQVGDRVFVGTADNYVYALDRDSGEPLWPEPFRTDHSIWGSPAYRDGLLFVNSLDATVYALDADTGQERWRTLLEGALASSPILNEDLVYVTSFDHRLHALDAANGEIRWEFAAKDWIWGSPSYSEGVVYFADVKGNVFAVDGKTGQEIWTRPVGQSVQTAPVVHEGRVYIGSEGDTESGQGLLMAMTADDGGELLWQQATPAPLYTTPVIVGTNIVVTVQDESALLLAYDLMTGDEVWRIPPPARG